MLVCNVCSQLLYHAWVFRPGSRVISHSLLTDPSTPPASGSTAFQSSSATSSLVFPASISTHLPSASCCTACPILSNTCLTPFCTSSFSYLSSPYPPLAAATSGLMLRNSVRSGAGSPTSGARHHSYGSPLRAENAIPENAYRSARTVVPCAR